MAREGGGGGGAFGWTILGIIVGVAATLAVQTLLLNRHAHETAESAASSASVVVAVAPVSPKPVVAAPPPAAPINVVAAPTTQAQQPSTEDVEDDAAAVGMTSRSHPSDAPTGAAN